MPSPYVSDSEAETGLFEEDLISEELLKAALRRHTLRRTAALDQRLRHLVDRAINELDKVSGNEQHPAPVIDLASQRSQLPPEEEPPPPISSLFTQDGSSQPVSTSNQHQQSQNVNDNVQRPFLSSQPPDLFTEEPVAIEEVPSSQHDLGPPLMSIPQDSQRQLQVVTIAAPATNQQTDFVPNEHIRNLRASRRTGASFYQQHIYTIDSVAYTLRISLDSATELVKQNPELIEKYHNGTLKKYLTSKKDGSTSNKKTSKGSRKAREPASEADSQHSDLPLSQIQELQNTDDDLYTDNEENPPSGHSSTAPSDADMSDSEPETNQPIFTFRGRTYKSLNEVARVSKLPKSYFQLQNTKKITKTQRRNKVHDEDKAGVARRKKKTLYRPDAAPSDDNLFTTVEASQEHDTDDILPYLQQRELEVVEIPDDFPDNEILHEQDDDLLMFDSLQTQEGLFYKTNDTCVNAFDAEIIEDHGSGFRSMLAPRSSGPKKPRTSKRLKRTSSEVGNKTKSFKRNPSGSVRKSSVLSSSTKRPKKVISSYKQTKTQSVLDHYQVDLERQNAAKYVDFDDTAQQGDELSGDVSENTKRSPKTLSKKQHRKSKYFFLAPTSNAVLPRSAQVSTVIYEGLSDKYAVLGNTSRNPGINYGVIEDYPSAPLPVFEEDSPTAFRGNFTASAAYKKLFENQVIPNAREYKIALGSKTFTLSKLLSNVSEVFKEIFISLLNPSTLRNTAGERLMESLIKVVEFSTELEPNEARSLLNIVDNFRFQLENRIRRVGKIRDTEFYYLSWSYILFYNCHKVFEENYLKVFDFRSKATEIANLYFQFLSYLDGGALRDKFHKHSLFSESLNMLFIIEKEITWNALETSEMSDMAFLRDLCGRFRPETEHWALVRRILKGHIRHVRTDIDFGLVFTDLKSDFHCVNFFVSRLGWRIDEDTLSLLFECLKRNKFQNFPSEACNPVIYKDGISKDSLTNIYLNLLVDYGKQHESLPARFLERIVPVSKPVNMNIETFCNRINILLCAALVFQKNLDFRICEIISSCELSSVVLQRAMVSVQMATKINNQNRVVTKLPVLQDLIGAVLKRKELGLWSDFLSAINFTTLLPGTQRNLLSIISNFKMNKVVIKSCTEWIKSFVKVFNDLSNLDFIKQEFGDINSSYFPELWCFISGELVRNKLENWSKLIYLNNFEDECYIFTYILRHSGAKIYQHEKNAFTISLIKNLVKRKHSSSLNAYIREIEKVDPKLLSTNNAIVQTQKLQLSLCLISSLLKSDTLGAKSKYLSVLVSYLKTEHDLASRESDVTYDRYAYKVIDFINTYGFEYVNSSDAFEKLCQRFNITRKISNNETNYLVNFNGNIRESLKFIEAKLIQCLQNGQDFTRTYMPLLLNHISKKFGTSDNIKDSKLYSICCSISIHIEIGRFFPSCWIILAELTKSLSHVLNVEKSLTRIDIFCVLKTIALFPHCLKNRSTRYEIHEYATLNNIYTILKLTFYLLGGTNDLATFNELTICFTSRTVLHEPYSSESDPRYLITPPEFIKDMIIKGNLTESKMDRSLAEVKASLEEKFNDYVSLVDDFYDDDDAFY